MREKVARKCCSLMATRFAKPRIVIEGASIRGSKESPCRAPSAKGDAAASAVSSPCGSFQQAPGSHSMKFRFPIVIIDEDYRAENTSRRGIRALAADWEVDVRRAGVSSKI